MMKHLSTQLKKILAGLAWSVLLLCVAAIAAHAGSCPQDLVAYWRLGESSAPYFDIAGDNDATCTVCPNFVTDGAIEADGGQAFDATDDGISVASNALFSWSETDNFSIELWLKRSPTTRNEVLIARKDGSNDTRWKLELLTGGQARFTLRASNGNEDSVTGSKILDNGIWHHIAAVRNRSSSDEMLLYVDGQLENQVTHTFTAGFESSADLTIGWIDDTSAARFGGIIDEVAIYGEALSDLDISAHYYLSRSYCSQVDIPIKIMPLGDSITDDNKFPDTSGNSYRKPLWDDLNANLFWVDFVGSRQNQSSDFDNDHEGRPGDRDDEIAASVQSILNANTAEVVLLHIGTNGLTNSGGTSPNDVEDILNNIDSFDGGEGHRITVVLARILDRVPSIPETVEFNNRVENMATARIALGDKIIMANMEDGAGIIYDLTTNGGDMHDWLHPNDSGYAKMSDEWYGKLDKFLPMTEAPQITSSPVETAARGQIYSYDVHATGKPDPVYSLTTAPSGMIIDAQSGLIQWTPTAVGDEDVVVHVQNTDTSWGTTDQTFTITVSENNAPHITSSAPTASIKVGQLFTYQAVAIDSDGDTLVWSISFGPAGLSVDPESGVVTWTPTSGDVGTANSAIMVSDGKSGEATQSFSITVSGSSGGGGGGGSGCFIRSLF